MRNYHHLLKNHILVMLFYFSLAVVSIATDLFSALMLIFLVFIHLWINYRSDIFFSRTEKERPGRGEMLRER